MSTLKKRKVTVARKPSDVPDDLRTADLEDFMLHKVDNFLYALESKMNDVENYGLEKLDALDSQVKHAYELLLSARDEVMVEGKQTTEGLVRFLESFYYGDKDSEHVRMPMSEMLTSGVSHLEAKLLILDDYLREHDLKASIQVALQAAANRLLTFEELPKPWQDNPYITRGYRFCSDYRACLCSVVKVHNETCNIWTHVLGFFAMLGFGIYHWPATEAWTSSTFADKLIMLVFLVAACKCLVFSAMWHTFSGISQLDAKKGFACADYTGITVLIAASIMTTEYAALYCHETARNIYMALTLISAIGGVVLTWQPDFDEPHARPKRVGFFVGFAVAGVLGFVHSAFLNGFNNTWWFYVPITKSLACYTLGVVAYSMLFPEKYFQNSKVLAYIGMSHNLWHVCVFGGIYYHYHATVHFLQNAKSFSCAAPA